MPNGDAIRDDRRNHEIDHALAVLGGALLLPAAGAKAQHGLNVNAWVPPSHLLVADVTMPFCKDMERRPRAA